MGKTGKIWKKIATSAAAFVLCATLGAGLAFALASQNLDFGGEISFGANNVMATVSAATVYNGSVAEANKDTSYSDKMQTIEITNTTASADLTTALATWSGLELVFDDAGDDVIVVFTITNNHESNKMKIELEMTAGTQSNATYTVYAGDTQVSANASGADDTQTLNSKDGTTTSVTYKVIFSVTDKSQSASISGFKLAFTLADDGEDA